MAETVPGKAGLGATVTGFDLESPAPEDCEALRRTFRASPTPCIRSGGFATGSCSPSSANQPG